MRAFWVVAATVGLVASALLHLLSFTRWGRLALLDGRAMVRQVPSGLRVMLVGAALYAWMNFVLCRMIELPPEMQPALTLRMATGHLIFFFLVPLVFFRFVAPVLDAKSSAETPSHP